MFSMLSITTLVLEQRALGQASPLRLVLPRQSIQSSGRLRGLTPSFCNVVEMSSHEVLDVSPALIMWFPRQTKMEEKWFCRVNFGHIDRFQALAC